MLILFVNMLVPLKRKHKEFIHFRQKSEYHPPWVKKDMLGNAKCLDGRVIMYISLFHIQVDIGERRTSFSLQGLGAKLGGCGTFQVSRLLVAYNYYLHHISYNIRHLCWVPQYSITQHYQMKKKMDKGHVFMWNYKVLILCTVAVYDTLKHSLFSVPSIY